jgi:hypothetical protein
MERNKMTKKPLLVCDDVERTARQWSKRLRVLRPVTDAFEVRPVLPQDLRQAVSQLEDRRRSARQEKPAQLKWGKHPFDKAAILVVDYDLLDLERDAYIAGENVAYLARCYSRCGLIVVLNQVGTNRTNWFDLTLRGHPESYADLNLGSEQIDNPGLWGQPWKGFRPWYWPLLPNAADAFERRVSTLKRHLDEPIVSFLGFPRGLMAIVSRSAREFIHGKRDPEQTTFRQFVTESNNGLRPKDEALNEESTARIAAARIAKWLERLVLPSQDILVDAPHLVSRYPSLLKERSKLAWNKTAMFAPVANLGIDHRTIAPFAFRRDEWLSRAAWWWPDLSKCEKVAEVSRPWESVDHPDYVFCEDFSAFRPRKAAREFVADVPSAFVRRFVAEPQAPGVSYEPSVRFSL